MVDGNVPPQIGSASSAELLPPAQAPPPSRTATFPRPRWTQTPPSLRAASAPTAPLYLQGRVATPETAAVNSRPPFLRRAHPISRPPAHFISPTLGPRTVPWHSGPFPHPTARELPAPGSGGGGATQPTAGLGSGNAALTRPSPAAPRPASGLRLYISGAYVNQGRAPTRASKDAHPETIVEHRAGPVPRTRARQLGSAGAPPNCRIHSMPPALPRPPETHPPHGAASLRATHEPPSGVSCSFSAPAVAPPAHPAPWSYRLVGVGLLLQVSREGWKARAAGTPQPHGERQLTVGIWRGSPTAAVVLVAVSQASLTGKPHAAGPVASVKAIIMAGTPRISDRTRGDRTVAVNRGRRYTRAITHRRAHQGSGGAMRGARRGKQRRGDRAEEDSCRCDRQQRGEVEEPSHLEPPLRLQFPCSSTLCVQSRHRTSTCRHGWGVTP